MTTVVKLILNFLVLSSLGQTEDLYIYHDECFRNNPKGLHYQNSNIQNVFIIDWIEAQEVDSLKKYYNDPIYLEFLEIDLISDVTVETKSTGWLVDRFRIFYNDFKKEKYWLTENGRPNPFSLNSLYNNIYIIRTIDDRYERVKVRQITRVE